jgi:anti-sigma-K factor RskA
MSEADDIDMLAAEYALGTLPAADWAAVALRAQSDTALADAIDAWELRLSPLAETVLPREAPAGVWERIEARIAADGSGNVVNLESRLRFWRAAAIAASALAASLALFLGVREFSAGQQDKTLVAVLQNDPHSPAFLVSVDLDQRQLTIRTVAARPEPGKSYELWLVHDDLKTPRSLGLVGTKPVITAPTLASYAPNVIENATLAVSLEPEGGSPTGAPTGPVLWSGKLLGAPQ